MKIHNHTSDQGVSIEIVPLIDVIFCILTFFILAALQLTRQQAINVDLPSAGTATLQNRQMLMVSVDALGRVYVDQSEVSEAQLYLVLEGYHRTNPQGLMVLYADRTSIYDDVVRVLDLMRSVGGRQVALATISGGTAAPGVPGVAPNAPGFPVDPSFNSPNFNLPPTQPLNPGLGNPPGLPSDPNGLPSDPTNPTGDLPLAPFPGDPLPEDQPPPEQPTDSPGFGQ